MKFNQQDKTKICESIGWKTKKANREKFTYEAKISPNYLYCLKRRGKKPDLVW